MIVQRIESTNDRLLDLILQIGNDFGFSYFDNIESITDREGELIIELKDLKGVNLQFYFFVFKDYWSRLEEDWVTVNKNGITFSTN